MRKTLRLWFLTVPRPLSNGFKTDVKRYILVVMRIIKSLGFLLFVTQLVLVPISFLSLGGTLSAESIRTK